MIEFTGREKQMIRWEMIRLIADCVAECGPYQIMKTAKRFKVVKNGDSSSVKYYPCLSRALYMITAERQTNQHKWIGKYGLNNVYAPDR